MKFRFAQSCWLLAPFAGLGAACSAGHDGAAAAQNSGPSEAIGDLDLALQVTPGTTLNSVKFSIAGPQNFARTGTIDLTNSSKISSIIGGLPVGLAYSVTLTGTATATVGDTLCAGSATFDVGARQTSVVAVKVACHESARTGGAMISGTLNICPVVDGITASPAEVLVGGSVALSGQAHDTDAQPAVLQYKWTASAGALSDPTSAISTFTCTAPGPVTLSLTVSDGDTTANCTDTMTATVNCTASPLQSDVQNIVVIYAENRSFDGLFGNFPGARGLTEVVDATGHATAAYVPQKDRDGVTVLSKLPQTWNGATAAGNPTVVTQAQTDNLVNAPFSIETAFIPSGGPALTTADVTRDMAHRFFENAMEINGGTNDMFGAFLDSGGLTMGHFDYSHSALYALAHDYVLADNFFQGAYGGSFLNHQYLICACAPTVPSSFVVTTVPSLNTLGAPNAKGVPQLATNASSPASALDGAPSFKTGNIAPLDYFGAGDGYRAVNTMQAPYQPSGNFPAAGATDLRYANAAAATTLPPQTQTNIGDLLSSKGVDWAWYATSWDAATTDGAQAAGSTHTVIYSPSSPRGNPDFQPHHHPFNYFANLDPATNAVGRGAHLKDYTAMVSQIAAGTLPPVAFYKPTGNLNQHPGYANVDDADAHIADLVNKLKAGPQWAHMVIVITYDEYGGQWDHVAPPQGDLIGPGTRIPAIIVSPYAKAGTVDHTQYDTASVLRLITKRYGLSALSGLVARDQALVAHGSIPMGDLTNALNLP